MQSVKTKIVLNDANGRAVTLSSFSLTNINYTFDLWLPDKKYNEICVRKDELINIFKVFKSFSEGTMIQELEIQDYDSPSTIVISSDNQEELSIEFSLTFPTENVISLKLSPESVNTTLDSFKEVLSLTDNKEYEEEMEKKHGMCFSF